MGINEEQLRNLIIRPACQMIELYSEDAVELLVNTARQESLLGEYLKQIRGPALGIFQMEPFTHDDHWKTFLEYKPELARLVRVLAVGDEEIPNAQQLVGNLWYAAAMARVHYLRVPHPLPAAEDIEGQAHYWKAHYNTPQGKGTPDEFMDKVITA